MSKCRLQRVVFFTISMDRRAIAVVKGIPTTATKLPIVVPLDD